MAAPAFGQDSVVAVRAAAMIDVARGAIVSDPVVVIRGGRIIAAGPAASTRIPGGATLIRLDDATLLPGLIDTHVHLALGGRPRENAIATLRAGFTTVQDLGALNGINLRLRDSIAAGRWVGPRIVAAGPWLGVSGGTCDFDRRQPSGAEAIATRAREIAVSGVDVIKLCLTGWPAGAARPAELSREEVIGVMAQANAADKRVVAHAIGSDGARAAIEHGVSMLAHSAFLDSGDVAAMRARGMWMAPTLVSFEQAGDESATALVALTARTIAQGVPIVFGTDAGVTPHGGNAAEFAAMARAGMSPAAAIRAATLDAARALGLADSLGTIAPGRFADLIAVRGNPLTDLGVLSQVIWVMQSGRVVER